MAAVLPLAIARADLVAHATIKEERPAVYYVSLVSHYPRNFSTILHRNGTARRVATRRDAARRPA
jgi:hypothetical protein